MTERDFRLLFYFAYNIVFYTLRDIYESKCKSDINVKVQLSNHFD